MSLLSQDIINQDIPVSNLLRRAKSLATKLNQAEFLKWINKELNGYANDDQYPDYRKISGEVKFWNPFYGWSPIIFSDPKIEKKISLRYTKQSIEEIEELLKPGRKGEFEMPYPADIAASIMSGASFSTKVSLLFDRSALVGILNAVRNRLQGWALELTEKNIKIDEEHFSSAEKEKAKSIKAKYQIEKIENFSGNLGELNIYQQPGTVVPKESFWSRFLWFVVVALVVIIVGNVISDLIIIFLLDNF